MASYKASISFAATLLAALAAPVYLLASEQKAEPPGTCFPQTRDPIDVAAPEPLTPTERLLAQHLARRYMIPDDTVEPMVVAAHRAAKQVGLDPLLLLAVVAVESSFNPVAESVAGAKGLMQIIPKWHRARLAAVGGEDAVFDPVSNIMVGAHILQEYVRRTGTLEAGLQFYNGAMQDESASYARKVMAERARLAHIVSRSRGT
jgi:soluble lytic murein transglycosylase-like protein